MIFVECEQGTPEWFQARAGVITASTFSDAISKLKRKSGGKNVGDSTDVSDRLAYETAMERITGEPYGDTFQTYAMRRGSEMESYARITYENRFGVIVNEAGIVLTDDRKFGYSTDGFVGEKGMIEVKTPIDMLKIVAMIRTGNIEEYVHQIQGGLWISGREWCDFVMYVPPLKGIGNDLYVKRIKRDEEFIDEMVEELLVFDKKVQDSELLLRAPFHGMPVAQAAALATA